MRAIATPEGVLSKSGDLTLGLDIVRFRTRSATFGHLLGLLLFFRLRLGLLQAAALGALPIVIRFHGHGILPIIHRAVAWLAGMAASARTNNRPNGRSAKLWRDAGKTAEAKQLLTGVFDRFAEGFETADLRTAKALMDEFQV